MGREILVAWIGRHQRDDWGALCGSFRERIARFTPIRDLPVRSRWAAEDPGRKKAEAEALLTALPDPCWLIALDGKGRQRTSPELGRHLARRREEWPHPIAFAIGSDLGLHEAVPTAAREIWSLGPLTLTHELARLVLYEQLYRAFATEAGINYAR